MSKNTVFTDISSNSPEEAKLESGRSPVTKFTPVIEPVHDPKQEQQLNVWVPRDLMKRLKIEGVQSNRSLKEMVIEALEQYL